MNERLSELSSRARRCIKLAIRDGRIDTPYEIQKMSDLEVMWRVRGKGQPNGIGRKTLKEVRVIYPQELNIDSF